MIPIPLPACGRQAGWECRRGSAIVAVLMLAMIVGLLAATMLDITIYQKVQSHRMRTRQGARMAAAAALSAMQDCLLDAPYPPSAVCAGWSGWSSNGTSYSATRTSSYASGGHIFTLRADWFADGAIEVNVGTAN